MPYRAVAVTASLLFAASGCGNPERSPTALERHASQGRLLSGTVTTLTGTVSTVGAALVAPLHRSVALAAPVSWSFTVDPAGGTSSNDATGLTIRVPRDAVRESVTITVTALAGSAVAYGFQPHGLAFQRPVELTQSLDGLDVGLLQGLAVLGGHFPGDEPVYSGGLALVDEVVGAQLSLLARAVTFPIGHFSGWIVATGRSDSGSSGDTAAGTGSQGN